MKKLVLFFSSFIFLTGTTLATVGGPEFIDTILYFPDQNEIRYLMHYENESGCPPTVHGYSLETKEATELIDCQTQLDQLYEEGADFKSVERTLKANREELLKDGAPLQEINMEELDLKIEAELIRIEKADLVKEEREFVWKFTPTYKKAQKDSVKIPICYNADTINFTGVSLPDSNFIAVIASVVSVCFETHYASDTFFIIEGINLSEDIFMDDYRRGSKNQKNIPQIEGKIHYKISTSAYTSLEDQAEILEEDTGEKKVENKNINEEAPMESNVTDQSTYFPKNKLIAIAIPAILILLLVIYIVQKKK
ncbi:hypothetical protein ACFL21_01085 [Patescibacteria group bacterium]